MEVRVRVHAWGGGRRTVSRSERRVAHYPEPWWPDKGVWAITEGSREPQQAPKHLRSTI